MKYHASTILALTTAAVMTTLSSTNAGVHGWSLGPSSMSLFNAPLLVLDESPMLSRIHERQRQLARAMWDQQPLSSMLSSSPRYELVDNDEVFQLSLDVPGVEMDDLDVSVDDENGYVTVTGQRTASSRSETSSSQFSAKFSQTFSFDDAVDPEKFTASLNNGVLVVTAPKDLKRLEETNTIKRIPITAAAEDSTTSIVDDAVTATTTEEKESEEDDAVLDLDKDDKVIPKTSASNAANNKIHVPVKEE
jgi:HSP20 family protein